MSTQVTSEKIVSSTLDGSPVGATTPSTGAFTTLTANTPGSSDNSTNAATTAWAKFGLALSLAYPGYIKLPTWLGGFTMQWLDTGVFDSGPVTITWPIAFANACLTAIVCQNSDEGTTGRIWEIGGLSVTGASNVRNDGSGGGRVLAIGF